MKSPPFTQCIILFIFCGLHPTLAQTVFPCGDFNLSFVSDPLTYPCYNFSNTTGLDFVKPHSLEDSPKTTYGKTPIFFQANLLLNAGYVSFHTDPISVENHNLLTDQFIFNISTDDSGPLAACLFVREETYFFPPTEYFYGPHSTELSPRKSSHHSDKTTSSKVPEPSTTAVISSLLFLFISVFIRDVFFRNKK